MTQLDFRLDARQPERRRIGVTLEFPVAAGSVRTTSSGRVRTAAPGRPEQESEPPNTVELFLPTWTPGSYLIREYSRHLGPVIAHDADSGAALRLAKQAKNRFAITLTPHTRRVRVAYSVYAHELSVRTADLTGDHAFWNHACVLLWPVGANEQAARITVQLPAGWDLACSLPRVAGVLTANEPAGVFVLQARNLDHALDSPCLAGRLQRLEWTVSGIPHAAVLDGLGPIQPPASLQADLTAIVTTTAAMFGGQLPYDAYTFLCLFTQDGHGGLEHSDSTVLLAGRTALRPGPGYQEFLTLAAHEFLHVWNVKRMRPAELWRYDYEVENYTAMLWLAEGFTAYYDDLLCLRCGILSETDYLKLLAKNLTTVLGGAGRFRQTLSDASFDAWIRLYRPDENTRNSTQNYYGNGAVVALYLDLTIRQRTAGERCLDDFMRALYRSTFEQGRGYTRDDVASCLGAVGGAGMDVLLERLVDGPLDPDLDALFAPFGLKLRAKERDKPYLGITFEASSTVVASVGDDGPAHAAGIAPGDEVIALAGVRVNSDRWAEVFGAVARVGEPLRVLIASRGLIAERTVTPQEPPVGVLSLEVDEAADELAARLRQGWLARSESRAGAAAG